MVRIKKRLKLYITAVNRYKRSRGFGIHSPFAFKFVLRVLREQSAYYAYTDIDERRAIAASLAHKVEGKRPKLISMKSAKMLFRIACYFHPEVMLQVGTSYGVSTTALLDVSSSSRLMIYKGDGAHPEVYDVVTRRYAERIVALPSLGEALEAYSAECVGLSVLPFVLVNALDGDEDVEACASALKDMLARGGVVVLRNLMRSPHMASLFAAVDGGITRGMTFTNSRAAVIVGLPHLPRQRFSLWF
ncbi:hypothetical protein [uncultured Muribaculum sp.]|uniref:hypothetical protein n=1 Tax=uncultured Muribaculum sp. TaxID=1918613 RepID=UPI0025D6FA83|nr:hypothetical protein [uncultured Muribaculum sp.]